ncbi:MAG: OmpA family protein [Bacteroidota bacterium]
MDKYAPIKENNQTVLNHLNLLDINVKIMKISGMNKLFVAVLAVTMLSACVSKKKYEELELAKANSEEALRQEISDRDGQIKDLETKSEKLQGDLNMSEQEVAKFAAQVKENNEKITKLHGSIAEAFETYDPSDISVSERKGKLYITMSNGILFDAGRARLAKDSETAVEAIASALKENTDLGIRVEGHTDNDPVKIHKYKYKDNWALSTARALAIVSELEKMGVDSSRLTAAGKGSTEPIASNDDKEGKEKNRRTEFIVEPKIDGLYRIYTDNKGSSK